MKIVFSITKDRDRRRGHGAFGGAHPQGRKDSGRRRAQGGQLPEPPDGCEPLCRDRQGVPAPVRRLRGHQDFDHRGIGDRDRVRDCAVFWLPGHLRQEEQDQEHRRGRVYLQGGVLHPRQGLRHHRGQGVPAPGGPGAAHRRFPGQRQRPAGADQAGGGRGRHPGGRGYSLSLGSPDRG